MTLKKHDIHHRAEQALEMGRQGLGCSEAVLAAFGPLLGLPEDLALKVACGLVGGVAGSGGTCGVVTASVAVLGLMAGIDTDAAGSRETTRRLSIEFIEEFEQAHGSLECKILCNYFELDMAERGRAIRESGVPEQLIQSAGQIIETLAESHGLVLPDTVGAA